MDIGKAFAYISEDEEWTKKLLVGALIGAVPFANFAIFGYQAEIARNVAAGEERPLPDWSDFGRFFLDGLRLVAAFFVYLLPMILLIIVSTIGFVFLAESSSQSYSSYGSSAPPSPEFMIIFGLMFACLIPYNFLIYALWPLFSIQIAREGTVGSCFQFSEMWRLVRAQPINYLLILVLLFGMYMVSMIIILPAYLLVFIPCIGYLIYMAIYGGVLMLILMVIGHLQGQFISEDNPPTEKTPDFDLESF
ncbi:MAG: DUF4013 domain-containing protein [Chloroflexi bacterium]|nr:DUF4013 domain-containing protein [Chloroflexota bacterium]